MYKVVLKQIGYAFEAILGIKWNGLISAISHSKGVFKDIACSGPQWTTFDAKFCKFQLTCTLSAPHRYRDVIFLHISQLLNHESTASYTTTTGLASIFVTRK